MRIFRQIPRFGYSLMDVGTGSIIFSSGLVRDTNSSSDPTLQAFEFKNTTLFQGLQAKTVWRRPTGLGLCRFTFFNTISILFFRFVFQLIFLEIFSWSNKSTGLRRVMKLWYQPQLNVPCSANSHLWAFVNLAGLRLVFLNVALHDILIFIFRQFCDFHFGSFGSFGSLGSLTCDVKHTISHDPRPVLLIGFVRAALMWGIEWNSVSDLRFALCNVEFYDLSICL